jgi:hypothetical protein
VVVNVTDLDDLPALAKLLTGIGWNDDVDDAEALAEEALGFPSPPAAAWTVLAHVAEHRGDYAGLERWTAAALGADLLSPFSLGDEAYLDSLGHGCGRQAGAVRRARHLHAKLVRFSGRMPQLLAQLDFCGQVLRGPVAVPGGAALTVAEAEPFAEHFIFDFGLVERFIDVAGDRLPRAELALARSWVGVRHRLVRILEHGRRRWRMVDLATGEVLVADADLDGDATGRVGFVLAVPVGAKHVVLGVALTYDADENPEQHAEVVALADDPIAVARFVLATACDLEHEVRLRFVFPDLDPDDVPSEELAIFELVRSRNPSLDEAELLLESIIAERIITRRVRHTWDLARSMLDRGASRDQVLDVLREVTCGELWDRARGEEAA